MSIVRHFVGFLNPRTGEYERLWFGTNRSRREYITDLQQDFGSMAIDEWEDLWS